MFSGIQKNTEGMKWVSTVSNFEVYITKFLLLHKFDQINWIMSIRL